MRYTSILPAVAVISLFASCAEAAKPRVKAHDQPNISTSADSGNVAIKLAGHRVCLPNGKRVTYFANGTFVRTNAGEADVHGTWEVLNGDTLHVYSAQASIDNYFTLTRESGGFGETDKWGTYLAKDC